MESASSEPDEDLFQEGESLWQKHTPETTVLVVEDEADTWESLITVIHTAFPEVHILGAASGFDALELLQKTPVDLILSDHKMPRMSGVKFLSEAHHLYPDVPRILMTAYGDLDVAIKAINEAHVDSFFLKPLQVEVIVDAVSHALGLVPSYPKSSIKE